MPVEVRYVVYHKTLGVFLGDANWSLQNPDDKDKAPTYTDKELQRVLTMMEQSYWVAAELAKFVGQVCFPDLEGHYASKDACANALLPRW